MEEELKRTKCMNKAATALIVVLLIFMGLMLVNMQHLAKRYEQLERRYVQLYEEMGLGEKAGLYDGKEAGR